MESIQVELVRFIITIVEYDEKRCGEITHPLDVAHVQMLPDVSTHDVPQFIEIIVVDEVIDIPIATTHVLVDSMHIQSKQIEQVGLKEGQLESFS